MKKQFTIFLILIFILGLVPVNFSQAITQNQIDAEVQIVCTDGSDNWFSGSGTIIDPKGIILTNRHVVEGAYMNTCFIGFIESINQEPNFGISGNYNLAEVKYQTVSNDMDAAILYLDNPTNKSYPYINIWDSNSDALQFGDKIEVIGFPSIGGSTITYTSGDFSGFGSSGDGTQNYIKSTAPLEHGNSGGASYNSSGQFMGIPTMVVAGTLNSMSYVLSVNSIKNWLSGILGSHYQEEVIKQVSEPAEPTVNIQNDITPPSMKGFNIDYEIANNDVLKQSYIRYSIQRDKITEEGYIKKVYYYFGENKFADPLLEGESFIPIISGDIVIPDIFMLSENTDQYFILKLQDSSGNVSDSVIAPWELSVIRNRGIENAIYEKAINEFERQEYSIFNKYSGLFVKNGSTYWWVSPRDNVRFVIYSPDLGSEFLSQTLDKWFTSSWGGFSASTGITDADLKRKPKNVWGHLLFLHHKYIDPINGEIIYFGNVVGWGSDGNHYQTGEEAFSIVKSLSVDISDQEIKYIEPLGKDNYVQYGNQWYKDHNQIPFYGFSIDTKDYSDFVNRLKGRILLQVEEHGEAYYVYPKDSKKYYMANGNEAYRIMRYLGVGITNKDLDRIKNDKAFAKKNSGKIFLQVEANGEAFYIDADGYYYYLKNGEAAYNIMRDLGLGITNNDLNKIPEGNL
ncbi:S1C family serine protease [Patescibacteria group bacterium]|nr:serine protease [Candidatus Falkowbacteria bacterium]MBU3906337.1 S1C family serine protease [Patescibacteria group bacterium]MBU4015216.1 S1C family serine protease [Patescibacteria group bacterium]MBU4026941.1 S1C family serine protease [Patescibacteria group bacterium]MBU4072521.1 S1C family serine protease [Patescibacteria group bacterium]